MKDNHRMMKRLLAFLLSAAMVITYMPSSVMAFTGEANGQAEMTEENVADESAEKGETPESTDQSVQSDNSDQAGTADGQTGKNEEAAGSKEKAVETDADKPAAKESKSGDTKDYTCDTDSVAVKVTAGADAFDQKVKLVVKQLDEQKDKKAYEEAEKALEDNKQVYSGMLAFDIHFENAKGEEIEPDGFVSVEMTAKREAFKDVDPKGIDEDTFKVTHIGSKETEVVADTNDTSKVEGTVDIKSSKTAVEKIDAKFDVNEFSTFTLTWNDGSATVHYGIMNGDGTFDDSLSETTTLDSTASKVSLDVAFSGYEFVGSYISDNESTKPGNETEIKPLLTKADDKWQYTEATTVGEKGTVENGNHIYVTYMKKSGSDTPTPVDDDDIPKPTTVKNVEDNGDGTFDIQLDIIGKQITTTETKGANVLIIFDRTSSMSNGMSGATNRFEAAKSAVHTLVTALNPGKNPIQMAVFSFDRHANDPYQSGGSYWTTSGKAVTDFTDALTMAPSGATPGYGGTNWQDAFLKADTVLKTADSDPTYVIFLTDGNPTIHNDTDRIENNVDENNSRYLNARTAADSLDKRFQIYGVLAANKNDGPLLETLMNDLKDRGHTTSHILASDSTTLTNSFKDIAQYIVENLGASDVSTTDGLPSLSSISAAVSGKAGGYKYYKAYEVTEKDGKYTYLDDEGKPVEIAASQVKTYDYVDGDGTPKSYKYYNRTEWQDAPAAGYTESTGVTWNLGSEGTLKGGNIYSVRFTVWPSQEAYDMIADLNNGKITMTDEKLKEAGIAKNGDRYTLKTNTFLKTKYTFGKDNYSDDIPYHEAAMNLPTETIKVKKNWNNALDERAKDGIDLKVTKDGNDYIDKVSVNKEGDWTSKDIFISCGQITQDTNDKTQYEVLETGHDYEVVEPAEFSYHWELTSQVYRPMVINGVAKVLIKNDKATGEPGTDYYVIEGHKYVVSNATENILTATNDRRSWLQLKKTVTGTGAPEDAKFKFTVKIKTADGEDVWFSANDPTIGGEDKTVKYLTTNATPEVKEGANTGYFHAASESSITMEIEAGWTVRFTNLPSGSTYEIVENDLPDGFKFTEAKGSTQKETGVQQEAADKAKVEGKKTTGTINVPNVEFFVDYTNEYAEVDKEITKTWVLGSDAQTPEISADAFKQYVTLSAGNENVTAKYASKLTVTADKNNSKVYNVKYTGLPKYVNGEEVTYTINETAVPGYTQSGAAPNIINTKDTGTLKIVKILDSDSELTDISKLNPDTAFTITGPAGYSKTVYLKDFGNAAGGGKEITLSGVGIGDYTVVENTATATATGYELIETTYEATGGKATVTKNGTGTVTVTNKYKQTTTKVSGKKVWKDGNDSARPDNITVTITGGAEAVVKVVGLAADDGIDVVATEAADGSWDFEITGLPKYTAQGTEIVYAIAETAINGVAVAESDYQMSQSGNTITNTKLTSVPVTKIWNDGNDQDANRPAKVTFQLYRKIKDAEGEPEAVQGKTIELTAADADEQDSTKWTGEFTKLPAYDASDNEIEYSVKELGLNQDGTLPGKKAGKNYTVSYSEDEDGLTVTNTYTPEKTTVSGSKTWDDGNDQDGKRPQSITINLLADGERVDSKTVTPDENGDWKYSFTDLDKYKNGVEIKYTVTEDPVTDYTTTQSGYNFTNTHTPEKIDVTVEKVWEDKENQFGIRPESVTINLYRKTAAQSDEQTTEDSEDAAAEDKELVGTVTLTGTAAETVPETGAYEYEAWKGIFPDMPKYAGGQEIEYIVEEAAVDGYKAEITGPVKTAYDEPVNNKTGKYTYTVTNTLETVDLEIIKDLLQYVDHYNSLEGNVTTTFVFKITGNKEGVEKPVYSTQVGIQLDTAGTASKTLKNLPKGLTYTVTEVYSGSYSPEDGATKTATISKDGTKFTVEFKNSGTDIEYGGGVINKYTKNDDGTAYGNPTQEGRVKGE